MQAAPGGVSVSIRVLPRSSTSALAGTRSGALLVRLTAPPVDGAANEALIELLARVCAIPKRAVTIVGGGRSRQKTVRISGVTLAEAAAKLGLELEAEAAPTSGQSRTSPRPRTKR